MFCAWHDGVHARGKRGFVPRTETEEREDCASTMRFRADSFVVARANIGIRYRRYKTAARFADFSKSSEHCEEEGQELCTGNSVAEIPRRVVSGKSSDVVANDDDCRSLLVPLL